MSYIQTRDISPDIPRFAIDIEKRLFSHDHTLWYTHRQETFLRYLTLCRTQTRHVSKRDHPPCHTQRQEMFLAQFRVLPCTQIEMFFALSHALPYAKTRDISRVISRFAVHSDKIHFSHDPTLCHTHRSSRFSRYTVLCHTQRDVSRAISRLAVHINKRIFSLDLLLCHIYRQETFLSAINRYAIRTDKRIFSLDYALPYIQTSLFSRMALKHMLYPFLSHKRHISFITC